MPTGEIGHQLHEEFKDDLLFFPQHGIGLRTPNAIKPEAPQHRGGAFETSPASTCRARNQKLAGRGPSASVGQTSRSPYASLSNRDGVERNHAEQPKARRDSCPRLSSEVRP